MTFSKHNKDKANAAQRAIDKAASAKDAVSFTSGKGGKGKNKEKMYKMPAEAAKKIIGGHSRALKNKMKGC
jgi:hypothetical protein